MKPPEQKPKLNKEKSIPRSLAEADKIFQELREAHWKNKEMIDREMHIEYPKVLAKKIDYFEFILKMAGDEQKYQDKISNARIIISQIKVLIKEYESSDIEKAKGIKREINQKLAEIDLKNVMADSQVIRNNFRYLHEQLRLARFNFKNLDNYCGIDIYGHTCGDLECLKSILTHPLNLIRTISLKEQKFKSGDFERLADILRHPNNKVTELHFEKNTLNDKSIFALTKGLTDSHNKVEFFTICDTNLTEKSVTILAEALESKNSKIRELWLSRDNINSTGAVSLSRALRHPNNTVKNIILSGNKIDDLGANAFCQTISHPKNHLTSLWLNSNQITANGATILVDSLDNSNCQLTELRLGSNKVSKNIEDELKEKVNIISEKTGRKIDFSTW